MRIVAGEFRGRRLRAPRGEATRPTSDRMRETLFNVLVHRFPGQLQEARVMDLFAGTGALGLEALSRGAGFCLFVESSAEARALIRDNVESLGLQGRSRIFRRDATRLGPVGTMAPFDLVLADPPYGKRLGEAALHAAATGGWLADDAIAVVEEAATAPFDLPDNFRLIDRIDNGMSVLRLLSIQGSDEIAAQS